MSNQDEHLLVLKLAKGLPELGWFLDRVLADPVLAGVFFLHRDELFQRQYLVENEVTIPLGALVQFWLRSKVGEVLTGYL